MPPGVALIVCMVAPRCCLSSAPRRASAASRCSRPPGRAAGAAPLPLDAAQQAGLAQFGVIGDFGTGKREQYQLGEQMASGTTAVSRSSW